MINKIELYDLAIKCDTFRASVNILTDEQTF